MDDGTIAGRKAGDGRADALSRLHQPVPVPAALPRRSPLTHADMTDVAAPRRIAGAFCFGTGPMQDPMPSGQLSSRAIVELCASPSTRMPRFSSARATATSPRSPRIYAHAVRHGTASFEIEPPDESRDDATVRDAAPPADILFWSPSLTARSWATPMPGLIARGRPIAGRVEDSIYVAPRSQRRGIGRALLDAPDRRVRSGAAFVR